MGQKLKIIFSAVIVLLVALAVARGCLRQNIGEVARKYAYIKPAKMRVVPAARLAIVLDDWGYNFITFKDAVAIGRPVTLSVIPNLRNSARVAEAAHAAGLGVMLHMPMEPISKDEPMEPHTIMTESPESEIRAYLDEALGSVPFAGGVNNHQGSAATGDARVMRAFLTHLKSKGIFFIDSEVVKGSQGVRIAHELHIPSAKRDVFLDNQLRLDAVKTQLRKAIKVARARGKALAIGHDHKVTLRAIKEMVPEIERSGVKLVLVNDLLNDE